MKFWQRGPVSIDVRPDADDAAVEIVTRVEIDELTASHEGSFPAMLWAFPKSVRAEVQRVAERRKKKAKR